MNFATTRWTIQNGQHLWSLYCFSSLNVDSLQVPMVSITAIIENTVYKLMLSPVLFLCRKSANTRNAHFRSLCFWNKITVLVMFIVMYCHKKLVYDYFYVWILLCLQCHWIVYFIDPIYYSVFLFYSSSLKQVRHLVRNSMPSWNMQVHYFVHKIELLEPMLNDIYIQTTPSHPIYVTFLLK